MSSNLSVIVSDSFSPTEIGSIQSFLSAQLDKGEYVVTIFREEDSMRTLIRCALVVSTCTLLPVVALAAYVFSGSKSWDGSCTNLLLIMMLPAVLFWIGKTWFAWQRLKKMAYALTNKRLMSIYPGPIIGRYYYCAFISKHRVNKGGEIKLDLFDAVDISNCESHRGDLTFHIAKPNFLSPKSISFLGVYEPDQIKSCMQHCLK